MASRDSLLNDLEEALRLAMDGRQATSWTAMPGIIESVDYTKNTCRVQPAIKGEVMNEDGTSTFVNLPILVDVPIVFPGAKGFALTFPITSGDEVLVVFAARCIDAWWQSGGVQNPAEARMMDLSDGFAIPGPRSVPNAIPSIATSGMQIRNETGSVYVEIGSNGKVTIVSTSGVDITGNLAVTGNITATGNISGVNITASGALGAASGVIAGSLSAGGVSIGGVPFGSHVHTGVTVGGGNTGGVL